MKGKILNTLNCVNGFVILFAQLTVTKRSMVLVGATTLSWSISLAVTFLGFAIGYFLSEKLINRSKQNSKIISLLFLFQGILILTIPFLTDGISSILSDNSVFSRTFFVILIPYFFININSALITTCVVHFNFLETKKYQTGFIMFSATLFGALSIIITTYYLIPVLGISFSCYALGLTQIIIAIIAFSYLNKAKTIAVQS